MREKLISSSQSPPPKPRPSPLLPPNVEPSPINWTHNWLNQNLNRKCNGHSSELEVDEEEKRFECVCHYGDDSKRSQSKGDFRKNWNRVLKEEEIVAAMALTGWWWWLADWIFPPLRAVELGGIFSGYSGLSLSIPLWQRWVAPFETWLLNKMKRKSGLC